MKKIKFSKLEKRVIIVLMLINCFALFVNVFGMDYHTKDEDFNPYYSGDVLTKKRTYDINYFLTDNAKQKDKSFYPFIDFRDYENRIGGVYNGSRNIKTIKTFRGIFPDYDYTEFLVYSLLIFGIPIIRKIW